MEEKKPLVIVDAGISSDSAGISSDSLDAVLDACAEIQAKINEVRKNRFEIELLRVKLQATERSKEDLCQLTTTLFKNTEFRRSVIQSRSEPILDQQGYMTGNYKDVSVNSFESVAPSKDDGTYDSQGNAL